MTTDTSMLAAGTQATETVTATTATTATATDATKTADTAATAATTTDATKTADAPTAPDKYADFTLPDGVMITPETLTEFTTLAKDLKLSQVDAQKVAELGAKHMQNFVKQQEVLLNEAKSDWYKKSETDKEFGGEKLKENVALAKNALETFGSPELKQMLNATGLENHPEVVRLFYRIGSKISGDNVIVRGGSGDKPLTEESAATTLYPTQQQKK